HRRRNEGLSVPDMSDVRPFLPNQPLDVAIGRAAPCRADEQFRLRRRPPCLDLTVIAIVRDDLLTMIRQHPSLGLGASVFSPSQLISVVDVQDPHHSSHGHTADPRRTDHFEGTSRRGPPQWARAYFVL